ncbi:hypothetical protein SAMN05216532_0721 [Streptomyces sp. 2231.1]|uniref:hypothetical protein n=1 Tax=Streptomyces sp. 2231.1 TaxID=1855347 RepID=UPI00089A1097|nr:hypothetical protein [Streptomyces sp. 2231.1]SEC18730.1 hypothetical protein SAMN05216532_0721 [Streptomyces sp. 2231.1]
MSDSDSPHGANGPNRVLESPIVGMSPWIVFSLVVGPGRFEIAVALACTVVLVAVGRLLHWGSSWKILEVSDLVFFAGLAVVGALADQGTLRWLETYAGEVSNIALVVIAFGSMAVGVPFTLQYAREQVDPAHWHTPEFLRTNHVITGVWSWRSWWPPCREPTETSSCTTRTTSGPAGSSRYWAVVAAIRFTDWYPKVVRARVLREHGDRSPRSPGSPVCCCPWPACSFRWGSPSSSSRTHGAACPSSCSASPGPCVTEPHTPWVREGL